MRDDILVGALKVEYNNLFFVGLRKVLEEQLYVDWLFKTSFLNVKNNFRELTQRKTYTTGADQYVEEYIKEFSNPGEHGNEPVFDEITLNKKNVTLKEAEEILKTFTQKSQIASEGNNLKKNKKKSKIKKKK